MPKVPGDSRRGGRGFIDSWLDDEASTRKGSRKARKKAPKSALSDAALANSVVTEVFPNQCRVILDGSGEEILCTYRRAQLLLPGQIADEARERTPVALGDRVLAERLNPQSGVVEAVAPRANFLARPAPGREAEIHVIAANIDLVVIVASIVQPEFSPGLVDRYLIASRAAGIHQLLCITKRDLQPVPATAAARSPWEIYGDLGYEWISVSAKTGSGIEDLKKRISGKTVVFCGHSGVGKTSLFRSLSGTAIGRVADVNAQTGKGRHTTTSSVLYRNEASG